MEDAAVGYRRVVAGRRFYLDTSSILAFGSSLRTLDAASDTYTSVLAVIEIIVAAVRRSENDYRRRRTAICALLEAPIIVIATVPEEFIFAAFSLLHTTHKYDERNRVLLLKYVVAHILKSENLAAFEAAMGADRHLAEALREFERYDAEVARGYVEPA